MFVFLFLHSQHGARWEAVRREKSDVILRSGRDWGGGRLKYCYMQRVFYFFQVPFHDGKLNERIGAFDTMSPYRPCLSRFEQSLFAYLY